MGACHLVRGLAPRWGLEQPRGQAGGHRQASFAHLRHLLQQQRPCPPGPPPKLALAFFCASLYWRGHACWWGHADRAAAPADHAAQARTLWRSRDGVRTAAQPRRAARAMQTRRTDRRCAQRGSQPATPGSRRPCHQPAGRRRLRASTLATAATRTARAAATSRAVAITGRSVASASTGSWGADPLRTGQRDGNRVGEGPDGRRLRAHARGDLFHDFQDGGAADVGRIMRAPRQPEDSQISPRTRAGVESLNPAALPKNMLGRREVPCLSGDAPELKLDAVLELAGARMSQLAPGSHREGEPRGADEVITVEAIHGRARVEEDQKIFGVMDVNCEVTVDELEGGDEHVGDLGSGHGWPVASNGGHHRAGENHLGLLHLNRVRHDDPHRCGGGSQGSADHRSSRWWRRRRCGPRRSPANSRARAAGVGPGTCVRP
ncbi:uncharacterized protein [Triticum aestivum]|uniref:uncharacterized protein n=1 Tax=Triticum aestivum TaxID=4565 RepID=UPI001D020464|nr:uncharacterized protein LOC123159114 [Triticum aestivum]XP_044432857.1 uncharacterized protein LOC123159114 [Triticum aestivum]XP_044432858.1 uncharacterized protein LOC123159114 [Triticum aestivum]XP_044432859.1 uncharacterized protein LOC123159114 [Triticum aestivum]XP_044432860.1 uncharacterized protein LOC123159114 [Triticum aestivum]XP_044432861.1 uncharacterized protein LOC123159114 [Triticum aestivum]XP_044432862.1 uncharacterized protein LOC123159114 [Triticum aestivum]XP_04443286